VSVINAGTCEMISETEVQKELHEFIWSQDFDEIQATVKEMEQSDICM